MNIPMSAPDLDDADIYAVLQVLRSGCLALGPRAEEFEHKMAAYVGVKHAVAVSSGTAALHLLIRVLGIGPGDEVLVPSFTFAASVNAILYERATPIFVDIDSLTLTLDPEDIRHKIGPRTKAIMAVDVFGHPAEWEEITNIADTYGLRVIDDACEALGAEYKGRRIGQFGDAATFAFYPNKQLTTGEGGIIVTNDDHIARFSRSLRNQGREEMGGWLEHQHLGYNYRMDEMSAALGSSQLERINTLLAKREHVAQMYTDRLRCIDILRPLVSKDYARRSWFVYVVLLAEGVPRDLVARAMESDGIPVRCYFPPVHLQPYIRRQFGFIGGELPTTESIAGRTLALPFHTNLTQAEVERVASGLELVSQVA